MIVVCEWSYGCLVVVATVVTRVAAVVGVALACGNILAMVVVVSATLTVTIVGTLLSIYDIMDPLIHTCCNPHPCKPA